jgi:ATP-dependent Clp protease ATP-binding subunit ClpC
MAWFIALIGISIILALRYALRHRGKRAAAKITTQPEPLDNAFDAVLQKARVERDRRAWQELAKELAHMGPKVTGRLILLLDEKGEYGLRVLAMYALAQMKAPQALELLTAALGDANESIRYEALTSIFILLGHWDLDLARKILREDPSPLVAAEALWFLHYKAFDEAYQEALARRSDPHPRMRMIAAEILAEQPTLEIFPYLLAGLTDTDFDTQNYYRAGIEKVFKAHPEDQLVEKAKTLSFAERKQVERYLSALHRDDPVRALLPILYKAKEGELDMEALSEFGNSLTEMAKEGRLSRAYGLNEQIDFILQMLTRERPPSIMILGEAGTGKTALIHELAYRLANAAEPIHIVEVSTGQIMSGTMYIGEWQTKLLGFVELIKWPKRVLWYVSNANDILTVGTTAKSNENFFALLQPFLEHKEICILGESTPQAFSMGLGKNPSTRSLFHTMMLQPKTLEETKTILRQVREDFIRQSAREGLQVQIPDDTTDQILELCGNYFPNVAFPGKAITFFQFLVEAELEKASGKEKSTELVIGPDSMYEVLSTVTGMPVDLIDDRVPLDLEKTRAFFRERVLGQEEAVDTVVDVITLIKAGLTNPDKPMNVLFFVGPTGVGKTEIAKTIAEYIFGSPERMIRLDMSEYQDYSSIDRLIGTLYLPGMLTSKIRQQPFSVVLLDEIEKGHPSIFDLLLQVFDDGRLTDAQGVTTDFRQTIIIMTSNIGSQIQTRAPIGFDGKMTIPGEERVLQEVTKFFRPEFVNRIDKIVVFRALDVQTMEKIARREAGKVLQRKGIARRRLVVDIDASVVGLLLREGFSPEYGARPMKRIVERRLLVPIAQAIVSGEVTRPGDILRIAAFGDEVSIRVVKDKQEDDIQELKEHIRIRVPFLEGKPKVTLIDCQNLVAELEKQIQGLAALAKESHIAEQKSALLELTHAVSFWDDADKARTILTQINHLEELQSSLNRVHKRVEDIQAMLKHVSSKRIEEQLQKIMQQYLELKRDVDLTEFDFKCREEIDRRDAYLAISRVDGTVPECDPLFELYGMYAGWTEKKGFRLTVLDDGVEPQDMLILLIEGTCAYGLLKGENGLHCFISFDRQSRKRQRALVKVEVIPYAAQGAAALRARDLRIESKSGKPLQGRILEKIRTEVLLTHTPSMTSVSGRNGLPPEESIEHLKALLAARLEQADRQAPWKDDGREMPMRDLVRNYYLAPNHYIKDLHTGMKTYAYRQIMEGNIDEFLLALKA